MRHRAIEPNACARPFLVVATLRSKTTSPNRIMVAGYTAQGDSFVPDKPTLWSEKALASLVNSSKNVDLAPDGKRIVAVMPVEGPEAQRAQNHVVFLENFFDELRRRAPANGKGKEQ